MEPLLHWLTEPPHLLMLLAAAGSIWMLHEYLRRRKRRLFAFCFGAGSGIAALLLIRTQGGMFGFCPPLSLPYLGIAAVCGIPGVLLLVLLAHFRI